VSAENTLICFRNPLFAHFCAEYTGSFLHRIDQMSAVKIPIFPSTLKIVLHSLRNWLFGNLGGGRGCIAFAVTRRELPAVSAITANHGLDFRCLFCQPLLLFIFIRQLNSENVKSGRNR
jgi:hypothetical protein